MKVAIPYGAFELKRAYQVNLSIAVLIAGILNILFVVSLIFLTPAKSQKPEPKVKPPVDDRVTPQPPPSVAGDLTSKTVQKTRPKVVLPSVGMPRAVLDDQVKEAKDFSTQEDIRKSLQNPGFEDEGQYGDGSMGGRQTFEERIPPSDSFIPYDEAPVLVKEVKPGYPDLARRSGMEGRVFVEAWVDKHGKVKEAKCLREGSVNLDIFCEAAIQAALKNEYKPAISNKVPVPCWVTYKVDFVLR